VRAATSVFVNNRTSAKAFIMGLLDALGGLLGLGGGGGGLIPSDITLRHKEIAPINIDSIKNIDPLRVSYVKDVEVEKFHNIAPFAAHIKEINHIDPLHVDGFNVSEVRNIDPLRVQQFNVTNLPHVNLSLRQIPPLDLNVRRVPPLSVGIHQNFRVPSCYTVSTQVLGLEVMRVTVQGETNIVPQDKYHREQSRTMHRSQAEPAAVGNAAIPARHVKTGPPREPCGDSAGQKFEAAREQYVRTAAGGGHGGLSFGMP
jgi:hypothetical protein